MRLWEWFSDWCWYLWKEYRDACLFAIALLTLAFLLMIAGLVAAHYAWVFVQWLSGG